MKVQAIITADVGNNSRRQISVGRIEAFTIATAMDTDADEFSIDIGMPGPDLAFLLNRDNEVLVSLFTTGFRGQIEPLHQGIADIVSYSSEDGILSIKGRDYSSVAADSLAPPGQVKFLRPAIFVGNEANELGITKTILAQASQIRTFERDGSETYWESWYRIYRKKDMWLWAEPDGTLISGYLNYDVKPTHYFGRPVAGQNAPTQWIPVSKLDVSKTTQSRVGKIWVYGVHDKTSIGFRYPLNDPLPDRTISQWVKRPLKIITSTTAKDVGEAKKEAFEEIFEGKVGAVELVAEVYTEQIIKQNVMAYINVPSMNVRGQFYIVGVTRQGGMSGNLQIVRLREKNYAISKRVPPDPQEDEDPALDQTAASDVSAQLTGVRWGNAFAAAALQYHGAWDYKLFLGVLLSICAVESSFMNTIQGRHEDWSPPPVLGTPNPAAFDLAVKQWKTKWANQIENPLSGFKEKGVGPMQLTTRAYKNKADDLAHNRDEYTGGRWIPEYNIMAAAFALSEKLETVPATTDANIWIGVQAYNGSGSASVAYRNKVRSVYEATYKDIANAVKLTGKVVTVGGLDVSPQQGEPKKIAEFVELALLQRGKPYEWGAEGPNTFDCSGLIDYCARQVKLTNVLDNAVRATTISLWTNETFQSIPDDKLQHGDLVFFDDKEHMGIYLTRNMFVQSPHTGDVVKISSMGAGWYKTAYTGARRIIPWQPKGNAKADGGSTSASRVAVYQNGQWVWQDGGGDDGIHDIGNAYASWLMANPQNPLKAGPKNGDTALVLPDNP